MSLSLALAELTGAPCHHMRDWFRSPGLSAGWAAAVRREPVDWPAFLADYEAGVDTPFCLFWREIADAFPDAPVLLSRRSDARTWWESMDATVLPRLRPWRGATRESDLDGGRTPEWLSEVPEHERSDMVLVAAAVADRVLGSPEALDDPVLAMRFYEEWGERVRDEVPADRLVEWQPGDGWEPLARALRTDVPDHPFPKVNTREEFRARQRG